METNYHQDGGRCCCDSPGRYRGAPRSRGKRCRGWGRGGGGDAAGLCPCPGGGYSLHGGLHVSVGCRIVVVGQLGGGPRAQVVSAEVVGTVVREDGDGGEGMFLDVLEDLTHL